MKEVNKIEALTAEIGNAEQAALIMRGLEHRAQARDLRSHAESDIAERFAALDEPERDIFLLFEDVQRVMKSRREDPALTASLVALARYEAKLDKSSGFAELFAQFRYRYVTGLPLEVVPTKVQQAIDIARSINLGELGHDGLFELAANVRECLSPRPKPQPKPEPIPLAPDNASTNSGVITSEQLTLPSDFSAIPDTQDPLVIADWIKGQVEHLLNPDWISGVPPSDKGSLTLLHDALRREFDQSIPTAVANNDLNQVLEIVQMVIGLCNQIKAVLKA